jgi:hypothetical protein
MPLSVIMTTGYLFSDDRWANADHLFGLSAECALKAVMRALGMTLHPDGRPSSTQHRVHINVLWEEFITFADTRGGERYSVILREESNPFQDWDISQRYAHRSGIPCEIVQKHQKAADMTRKVLQSAVLNGDIR